MRSPYSRAKNNQTPQTKQTTKFFFKKKNGMGISFYVALSQPKECWQMGGRGKGEGAGRAQQQELPGPADAPRSTPSLSHTHPLALTPIGSLDPRAGLQPRLGSRGRPGRPRSPRVAGAPCGAESRVPRPFVDNSLNQLEFGRLRGGPDVTRGHVAPPPAGSLSRK